MSLATLALGLLLQPVPGTTGIIAGTPARPDGNPQSWITTDDYPEAASLIGAFGTTEARMQIGEDGRVQSCEISMSSGNADLDNAACALLTERARYFPARDGRGRALVSTATRRVRWALPDMGPVLAPVPGYTNLQGIILRLRIGEDGRVAECQAYPARTSSNPQRLPVEAQICAEARQRWANDPAPNVPAGGFWLEERQIRYIYGSDPGWSDGQTVPSPPLSAPPLRPDET